MSTKKKAKPAGGYIGQAMEAARHNQATLRATIRKMVREVTGSDLIDVRKVVREELATLAGTVPSEPTERDWDDAVRVYITHSGDTRDSLKAAFAYLRSKP